MNDRLVNIIQWASIVIGITGMSFDKFISVDPTISYLLIGMALAAFAVLVIVQIFYRDPNKYNGKQEVDLVWRRLLIGADRSVGVFAGDVSWARSNKADLSERSRVGVEIRVICRWPSTPLLLEQVRALFESRVQVKFFSENLVKVRGLVVDTRISLDSGTALTVVKIPKKYISLAKGQAGTDSLFNYEARRYIPNDDLSYIAMLHQLFDSVWETLPMGLLLTPVELSQEELVKLLSRIPQYERLSPGAVSLQKVPCASLFSCCRTVKVTKLAKTTPVVEGYRKFQIDCFAPCRIESNTGRTVILPHIVEQQPDGKLVVVDGMHRIYNLISTSDAQEVFCLVITGAGALPSDPVPFLDVRTSTAKKPRGDNFPNYKHENFRDIKSIDRYLATVVDQYSLLQASPSSTAKSVTQ